MTVNIAKPKATSTSSQGETPPALAASSEKPTECPHQSCNSHADLMLCEVRSYRRGMHDDGHARLIYVPERCEACPFERCV